MSAPGICASGEDAGTHSVRAGIDRTARGGTDTGATARTGALIERGWTFADLKLGVSVTGSSATRTAPPASRAPPAAVAESFAKADFTDMQPYLTCPVPFTVRAFHLYPAGLPTKVRDSRSSYFQTA